MKTFASFDGTHLTYFDEGTGPAVILLHGYGLDALSNWGHFDRLRPLIEKNLAVFKEHFGASPPVPNPPAEGQVGLIHRLLEKGARVIALDQRGFGASDKPTSPAAYANSAMARDVVALIHHLHLEAVDVLGFSMGALTAASLLELRTAQVKSAILAGISQYVLDGSVLEFPKNFPVPDYLPRPLTNRIWAQEGAKLLEGGEFVPGHLASAHLIMAKAGGFDPKALAAVLRGAIAEGVSPQLLKEVKVPVLFLNGSSDVANQKIQALLDLMPHAQVGKCEGDHYSTPFQLSFQQAAIDFFEEQWRDRA
jgi:pimeloyl-ACP methyl ester carboxylesterase